VRYGRADVLVLLDRDFRGGQEFTVRVKVDEAMERHGAGVQGGGQESHIFVGSVIGGRHKAGSLSSTSVTRGLT